MTDDPREPGEGTGAKASTDVISQIERLAALKDKGHITEAEFAAQKACLLGYQAAVVEPTNAGTASVASDPSPPVGSATSAQSDPPTSHRRLVAAGGLLIVAAIGFGIWFFGRGGDHAATSTAASSSSSDITANSAALRADDKLARIFTPDVLGENVRFLETITGPPFTSDKGQYTETSAITNTYKVDGCYVIVGVTKGTVDNVGILNYSQQCKFDIGRYFHQKLIAAT